MALRMVARFPRRADSPEFLLAELIRGIATAAMTPRMTITITSSTRLNAFRFANGMAHVSAPQGQLHSHPTKKNQPHVVGLLHGAYLPTALCIGRTPAKPCHFFCEYLSKSSPDQANVVSPVVVKYSRKRIYGYESRFAQYAHKPCALRNKHTDCMPTSVGTVAKLSLMAYNDRLVAW